MMTRWNVAATLATAAVVPALLVIRPFATSMILVFAVLALVAGAIARDAFVPDRPQDR